MSAAADVRMALPARAEGVAVVRQALAGLADALGVEAAVLADMKMAVSEACTNVVVHAYPGGDGVLEVEMESDAEGIEIRVRDHGVGVRSASERAEDVPALGLGLPLIAALSDAFALDGEPGSGTQVRMTFRYARDGDPAQSHPVQGSVGDDGRWDPDATRETPAN